MRARALFVAVLLAMAACSTPQTPSPATLDTAAAARACASRSNDTQDKLLACVTRDGVREHRAALQAIADVSAGTRTSGTPGYDASVAYVVDELEAAGYDVAIQPFAFRTFVALRPTVFERVAPPPAGPIPNRVMSYSGSGDVTASVTALPVAPADATPGCEAAGFAGVPAGDIASIGRGACAFALKATNAYAAGAVGVVKFNNLPGAFGGTLGNRFALDIPVTAVAQDVGLELAATAGLVLRLKAATFRGLATSYSVLAETSGGDPDNVIMVGAHLDSVNEGPGINDSGSGSAAILETAVQMARVRPLNTVRFAWWGAEESGLVGSSRYVTELSADESAAIALYPNSDMIGWPNHGLFVYDGDDSDGVGAGPARPAPARSRRCSSDSTKVAANPTRARTSAADSATDRSSPSESRPVACSPAPRASRRPRRRPSGAARPGSSTPPATTWRARQGQLPAAARSRARPGRRADRVRPGPGTI